MHKILIHTVTNDLTYDQRMIRICTSLAKDGHRVILVGRKRRTSIPLRQQPFEQVRLFCGVESGFLFYAIYNLRLFWYLLFKKFDVATAIDLDTIAPVYLISRWKGKKVVYDAHEYFTEVPEVIRRPKVKKIWEWIAETFIPKVDAAYTVGYKLAEVFEKKYEKAFGVVRNVPFRQSKARKVIKSGKKWGNEEQRKVILYQGALNEGRGLEQCIEAMPFIQNAQLWLAGEGDISYKLRELAKALHLEDKVHFLGYVQPDELKEITNQAYIGLNLLEQKGLSYYYSLANKAFDYIQAGKPSLNCKFPEYEWLNEKWDVFVLVDNLIPKHIAGQLQKLLTDEDFYQQKADNCKAAAKVLNWENEEAELLKIYRDVLEYV